MELNLKVYVGLPDCGCVDVGELMLDSDKLPKPPGGTPSHWTPLQIEMLLHYYYSPKNWVEVRGWSQAFDEQWEILYAAGLLEERDDTDRESGVCLTDKGRAFVERILATSIPGEQP